MRRAAQRSLRLARALGVALAACADGADKDHDPDELLSGGAGTVLDDSRMAFAQALPALRGEREDEFFVGNAIFNRPWVTAPASVEMFDGLGPLFNATNCSACHLKDGRGRPPEAPEEGFSSMLIRLGVPGSDQHGEPLPDPIYGGQLQDSAVLGLAAEGIPRVSYAERAGRFDDGTRYALRVPSYSFDELAYGDMSEELQLSPRVAPAVFGLGLLAAIPDAKLEALADPDDRDGDGVSGRVNHVWDVARAELAVGRFGWKANQPTLAQQVTGALLGDMGITSSLFPGESCTDIQPACAAEPSGAEAGAPEASDAIVASLVHYMHTLAVPARRRLDASDVRRGKRIFMQAGCAGCHVPKLETGELAEFPELSGQTIRPYTDLLLHDMGPELADGRPDFEASGSEWRTPPLWGIGLVRIVNRHSYFLHDGRARGLLEAVLWHGGEAALARDAVLALDSAERDALVAFLESL
jgi:CxxC motif-containing protein (DUF1111 family)